MKRILGLLFVSLGLAACGSHEKLDASLLADLPTATLKFAATAGLNTDLNVTCSVYVGSLGTNASCGQTFDGCYGLADGLSANHGANLCPGAWTLGAATLYDSNGSTCTGNVIADCTMGTGGQNLSPGTSTVSVSCSTSGHAADDLRRQPRALSHA